MKDVQCYELFGGIALKNHAFSFSFHNLHILSNLCQELQNTNYSSFDLRLVSKDCYFVILL